MTENVTTDAPRSGTRTEDRLRADRVARVEELIAAMTLEKKLGQLYGLWAVPRRTAPKSPRTSTTWTSRPPWTS